MAELPFPLTVAIDVFDENQLILVPLGTGERVYNWEGGVHKPVKPEIAIVELQKKLQSDNVGLCDISAASQFAFRILIAIWFSFAVFVDPLNAVIKLLNGEFLGGLGGDAPTYFAV
ncbi:MAG: hypothetical protein EOO68_17165 [Moraxellaceae bacterium]|nr:MAG: hypothetical protein EOO68_17165 [Moraxellaceae bacterium]